MGVQLVKRARACGLKGSKLATLIALADRVNEKRLKNAGCCWPSLKTLANDAGYRIRTVQARLNELETEGHITRSYRTGRSTKYRVHPGGMPTPANFVGVHELRTTPADFADSPRKNCGETIRNQKGTRPAVAFGTVASGIVGRQTVRNDEDESTERVSPEEFSDFVKSLSEQV